MIIRRAQEKDIPQLDKLLFQVNKVHSDGRPDLFKAGAKKYSDDELKKYLVMIIHPFLPLMTAAEIYSVMRFAFLKQHIQELCVM